MRLFTLLAATICLVGATAVAQPRSAGAPDAKLVEDLVAANRVLVDLGVLDGFGHVSVRHDKDPNRYLMSRSMAPALVKADDILEFDLDNVAVDAEGKAVFLERFIHGEIYKARPDVKAVVHSHSPSVIPFGVSKARLRPIYHMSSFMGLDVPVFEIREVAGAASDLLDARPRLGDGRDLDPAGRVPRLLCRDERAAAVGGDAARRGDLPHGRGGRGSRQDQRRPGDAAVGTVETKSDEARVGAD